MNKELKEALDVLEKEKGGGRSTSYRLVERGQP